MAYSLIDANVYLPHRRTFTGSAHLTTSLTGVGPRRSIPADEKCTHVIASDLESPEQLMLDFVPV